MIIQVNAPETYPAEPFVAANLATSAVGAGRLKDDGSRWWAFYAELSEEQALAVFAAALTLTRAVALPADFDALEHPLSVVFVRNDNNIWAKAAPQLGELVGHWLRGTLGITSSDEEAAVTLEPLAGEQPGWKPPHFATGQTAESIWVWLLQDELE